MARAKKTRSFTAASYTSTAGLKRTVRPLIQQLEPRQHFSFSEDFSAGAGNFTASGGTWGVVSQAYTNTTVSNTTTTHLNNVSTHNTSVSGDFVATADAKTVGTSNAWNDVAIVFGYQDANNYYLFSSNESNDGLTSGIFKVSGGTSTELADVTSAITSDTTYQLKVERTGSQIKAYRNGTLLASATDSTFTSGKIGFGSKGDQVVVDNLVVTTGTTAVPAAPSALTAAAASSSQINLTWADNSSNELAFTIDRATNSSFTANLVSNSAGANATSYAATGLAANTTYYFRVRATNANGASANSATASAATTSTSASTVYVGADPDNNGTGTSTNPYGSLNAAFQSSAVVAGSQILVQSGTYGAQTVNNKTAANSFAQNVTIKPAPGATPVFTAAVEMAGAHITVSGFTFDRWFAGRAGSNYLITENNTFKGGTSFNADYNTIRNNSFVDGTNIDAVRIQGASSLNRPSTGTIFEGNFIKNYRRTDTTSHVDGIQIINSVNVIIRNNRVSFDGTAAGVLFTPTAGPVYNVLIENNFFVHGAAGLGNGGKLLNLGDSTVYGVTVINNTIMGSMSVNKGPNNDNVVRNNIIGRFAPGSTADEPIHDHNYIYDSIFNATLHSTEVFGPQPKFLDKSAVDLHLVTVNGNAVDVNNNAINLKIGTATGAPTTDIDGQVRDPLIVWVGADQP